MHDAMDSSADLTGPLIGLWLFHNTRGEFAKARESIQELFRVAHALNDPDLLLQAHHAAWPTPMLCGDFAAAYKHVEQGLALYDEQRHRHHAFHYIGHDPAVCAHALGAMIAWVLGRPQRAARHADSAMQFARRVGTCAHACSCSLVRMRIPCLAVGCRGSTHDKHRALALCEQHQLAHRKRRECCSVDGLWCALARLRKACHSRAAGWHYGSKAGLALSFSKEDFVLAETCSVAGRPDEAMELLDAALVHGNKTGEKWCEARIHHLRAQLLIASEEWAQAEQCLRRALDVARQQNALSFELRSATRLAGLWRNQGLTREAHDLLALSYSKFEEGFDTPDLRQAKALLDELH